MASVYIVEDDFHAEWCGEYKSFSEALKELKLRADIPWNKPPNICPCTNWENCERNYAIIEYDNSTEPWEELHHWFVLDVGSKGTTWNTEFLKEINQNE